ncbi:MAG: hypothetical protein AAFO80_03655 [Pseudomonadota bacterium]
MANNTARKPRPKADPVDPTHLARPHKTQPAAAPLGTDSEAGGHRPTPVPREEPADTYMVNSDGEVRAGPGDAGAQDTPRVLDNPQNSPRQGRTALIGGIVAGLVILLLIFAFSG